MKFLSKYRRHKFATPMLLVIALSTLGFTFSAATASPAKSELSASAKSTLIAEGKEIFLKGCSSCHGLNAEGASIAPSLIGVGAASVDFQVGTGRMPMADMSQQAMRKAPLYTEEETAALAAYVATLAPGPASITNEEITWERDGSTAGQGGALTQGKYAPTVMGVEPKHIYEAMITGPQAMPVFSDKTITPQEKLSIIKWIKSAESEPNLGGASLGRVGPVTEGLLVWTFGLGLLVAISVWLTAKSR
jgi:ubiquinol-cytochrome c reductase cytochrome c subunit